MEVLADYAVGMIIFIGIDRALWTQLFIIRSLRSKLNWLEAEKISRFKYFDIVKIALFWNIIYALNVILSAKHSSAIVYIWLAILFVVYVLYAVLTAEKSFRKAELVVQERKSSPSDF